jgi:hypothetical protein
VVPFVSTGAVLGSWGRRGDEERGFTGFYQWSIKSNGVGYLYLSSLADEHSHKGTGEAGESS